MKLSIIIPCHNEEGNVHKIYDKILEEFKDTKIELIFIDDGSRDKTIEELEELYNRDKKRVRVISFSRNFNKEAAIYAGLVHSTGDYTCIIDADLQQNPKYLVEMINYLDDNPECDQVVMTKIKPIDNSFIKFCKRLFYNLIDSLSDTHFEKDASDFRMFRKSVTESILKMAEVNRFSKGIFSWLGYKTKYLQYEVEPRLIGKTKFNFKNSFKYALDGIVGYTVKPLLLSFYLGLFILVGDIGYLIFTIIRGSAAYEYSILIIIILFISSIQLIALGIIGEYLSKLYLEIKNRPIYIARKKLGFEDDNIL